MRKDGERTRKETDAVVQAGGDDSRTGARTAGREKWRQKVSQLERRTDRTLRGPRRMSEILG